MRAPRSRRSRPRRPRPPSSLSAPIPLRRNTGLPCQQRPHLSATERQDLIEDLNEDGISDPKQPVLEDLPLIMARLDLIESLAPEAMDEVNADAFAEAYKDLLNLALVALGRGEPVR